MEKILEFIDRVGWTKREFNREAYDRALFSWAEASTNCILRLQEENKRLKESLSSMYTYLLELSERNI